MSLRRFATTVAVAAALASGGPAGCAGDRAGEPAVTAVREALSSSNALISNALISNALISNALISNALISNALISNALISNALISNALRPDGQTEGEVARMVLRYMYSCAMPAGTSMTLDLDGTVYQFDGALGLAPEWGQPGGACDTTCQRWISACLLARTNVYGTPVAVSLRGSHPALRVSAEESAEFSLREGSYYGNLFVPEAPAMYACSGPGSSLPALTHRFCSAQGDTCPIATVGECVATSCSTQQQACSGGLDDTGAAGTCYDRSLPCDGGPAPDAVPYTEVITVYLRQPTASCGNALCEIGEGPSSCAQDCRGWGRRIGGERDDEPTGGLAATSDGGLVTAGYVRSDVDLGGSVDAGYSGEALYVKRLSAAGDELWSIMRAGARPLAVTVDGQDNTWLLERLDTGAMRLSKLDPLGHVVAQPVMGSWSAGRASLATDAQGAVLIAGTFSGTVTVGPFTLRGSGFDGFVAKVSAAGTWQWAVRLGGGGSDAAYAVTADADGGVLVGGAFSGKATLAGKTAMTSAGGQDAFVVKLSASGAAQWQKRWGGTGNDRVSGLARRPGGGFVLAGRFSGSVSFGGATLTALGVAGDNVVAFFDGSGAHVASRALGKAGVSETQVSVAGAQVVVSGTWAGGADFGAGVVQAGTMQHGFAARYDGAGVLADLAQVGGPAGSRVYGAAVTPDAIVMTGSFVGTGLFGAYYLTNLGGADATATFDTFLASLPRPE